MIFEGIKLMLVGMTTVLLFLIAMILIIQLVSYLTRGATVQELASLEEERKRQIEKRKQRREARAAANVVDDNADQDIAVIAAAVAAYEAEKFASS